MFLFPRLSASASTSTASIAPVLNKRLFSSFQPKDKILVTSLTPKFHDAQTTTRLSAALFPVLLPPAIGFCNLAITNYVTYGDMLGLISSSIFIAATCWIAATSMIEMMKLSTLKKLQLMQEKQEPTTFGEFSTFVKNARLPDGWSTYVTVRSI